VTRFFADPFVERYSPTAVARVLLGVLGAGVFLVFFAPSDWLAPVGFAMMGIGTSVIFSLAMSAAAQLTDRPALPRWHRSRLSRSCSDRLCSVTSPSISAFDGRLVSGYRWSS
jgi:MFS family permease